MEKLAILLIITACLLGIIIDVWLLVISIFGEDREEKKGSDTDADQCD